MFCRILFIHKFSNDRIGEMNQGMAAGLRDRGGCGWGEVDVVKGEQDESTCDGTAWKPDSCGGRMSLPVGRKCRAEARVTQAVGTLSCN